MKQSDRVIAALVITGAACMMLAAAAMRAAAQAPPAKARTLPKVLTTASGVYTAAQAAKGEQVYMSFCVSCHPSGAYATAEFREKWNGAPLSKLFDVVTETMPKSEPGSLDTQAYVHVISYILKINGAPVGKTPLPDAAGELRKIRIHLPRK